MTKNGKVIVDIIESNRCHPSAEEIYGMVVSGGNKMSVATIYNNLASLCEEGMITKITSPGEPDRYDNVERHDHLICSKCGGIKDLYLSDITKSLKKEAGVEFDSYDLRLIYVCDKCKAL